MPNFAEKSKKDKIFFRCYVFWFWSFYTFQYKKKEKEISMRRGDEKQVSDLEQPKLLKDAKIVTVGLTPIYLKGAFKYNITTGRGGSGKVCKTELEKSVRRWEGEITKKCDI